jgi:gamma-glutamyltranspeptidase/glutathione hydrolase
MDFEFEYPWRFDSRRSAVMSTEGMVATSHPVAAGAGARVLEEGGTAADAAVTTAAVLNVVEPGMTGIGGDMFALTHFDGDYEALNGSGGAPAEADLEAYRERTDECEGGEPVMPAEGGLPVTVPGALDGWQRLVNRYGAFDLSELLDPAIERARGGVPVPEYVADTWARAAPRLRQYDASAETYLLDGEAPGVGEVFRNPDLADTFETIATEGICTLYGGEVGERVVERARAHGSALRLGDLEDHAGQWTCPVSTTYRGLEVLEHPPNGQGTVALEALNVAENFGVPGETTHPDRLHHLVEAIKVGFADGYEHITDPERYDVPMDALLSKEYAAARAESVGHRAGSYAPGAKAWGSDTVYLSVVDGEGNAVSFINSIYMNFGSALVAAGFALQNRGHSFSLDPEHANSLEPEKRPYHTIIPAMLREDGEFRGAWGVMGGDMQPQGHLQVVSNLVDGHLNPQAALDAPRFRWLDGKRVALETNRVPDEVVATLRARGHRILEEDPFLDQGGHWGGGQAILRTAEGVLIGGSDPRKDGHAVGL